MDTNKKPTFPKKGGGEVLRKLFEENQKRSRSHRPSREFLEIIQRQRDEEEKRNKKSAISTDLDV